MAKAGKSFSRTAILTILTLALAACSGTPDVIKKGGQGKAPSKPQSARPAGTPAFSSAESRQCLTHLQQAGAKYTPLSNQMFGGGCDAIDSVKLLDIGVPTTNLGAMTCPLARTFAGWVQYAVRPAARQFFAQEVVKVETFGTYSCRNVYGRSTGKLSEHARSNAIDISAFVLADGRRVTVLAGWNGAKDEQEFLRALHRSACRRFGTALGPQYNRAHHDHFHFDMSGNGFCR
jgi:hypothetical protein